MKKKIVALALVVCLAAVAVIGASMAYFTDTKKVENTFTMGNVQITLDEKDIRSTTEDARTETGNDYSDTPLMPGVMLDKDPTIHVKDGSQESYIFLDLTLNKYKSLFWVMAAEESADDDANFSIFDDNGAVAANFKNDNGVFSTTEFISYMVANKSVFQPMIDKWLVGIKHADWQVCDIFENDEKTELTVRLAYQGDTDGTPYTVLPAGSNIDIKFMDRFGIPASVTQEMIDSGKSIGKMANAFNTDSAKLNLTFTAYAIQAAGLNDVSAAYQAMFGETMPS